MSSEPAPLYFVGSAYGPRDAEADRKVKEFLRTASLAQRRAIFVRAYFNVGPLPRAELDELVRQIEQRPRYELELTPASSIAGLGSLVPPEARNTRRCFVSDDTRLMVAVTGDGAPCGYVSVAADGSHLTAAGVLELDAFHGSPRCFSRSQIDNELRRVLPGYVGHVGDARATLALRSVSGQSGWMGSVVGPIHREVVGPVGAMVTESEDGGEALVEKLWQAMMESTTEG